MQKIFTILFAALMSVGMYATTVTWDSNTLSSLYLYGGESFPEGGVTLTVLEGEGEIFETSWMGDSENASFKFSTSLGNFTRIEITGTIYTLGGSGWTETSPGAVWTGDANETTFGMNFEDVSQIVFTIAEPAPTTYTLQLVADPEKGSVALQNPSSDIIDNGNGNYTVPENAEVTILATPNEGYEFIGWKAGNTDCDFTDCGYALNTTENPMTIGLVNDIAIMAEFAAVTPQPAEETTTVTWDSNTLSSIGLYDEGESFTEGGVTVMSLDGTIDGEFREWAGYSGDASFKFSTSLGNFTRIEITATINGLDGSGWTQTSPGVVWTGDANETTFGGNFENVSQIVFTIEEPEPTAVENVQTNQLQSTKVLRDGQILILRGEKTFTVTGQEVK